jgi:hypothetical protein
MDTLTIWQYSPLVLNGKPVPFVVLTVTFTFSAEV